jgi:hypothetical protein
MDEVGNSDNQKHQMALSFTLRAGENINVDMMHSTRLRQDGFFNNRILCSPSLRLSPAFRIAPVAIISCNATEGWRYAAGLKQMLTLREKTFSEFNIEQDLPFSSWEKLRAQGRMSFLF